MASKPILTYFNGRGRAEPARLILAEAGVEYEDIRVSSPAELKASGKLPFGQLPLLEINGVVFSQSMTIARYLAKKHGLYGHNDEEAAIADMVVDGFGDLMGAKNKAQTDEDKQKFASQTLPTWLGFFENILKHHGGEYFAGVFTYADLIALEVFGHAIQNHADAWNAHPLLAAHHQRISSRPKVAAWIAKRPQTPF